MPTTSTLITADELLRMPNPDDARIELVRGELRTMPPAGFDHGARGNVINGFLWAYVRAHQLGIVPTSDTGYRLSSDPDTVRCPDVSFVGNARLPGEPIRGFFAGAPDLAVEVVSPNDSLEEVEEKVDEYLSAGTKLVWVVSPRRRTVTIHRPGAQPQRLNVGEMLSGEDVVPGFSIALAEIFA